MMTILRDVNTVRSDFIFYTDRLATLVIETAMTLLPFDHRDIVTPLGVETKGKVMAAPHICGVTIIRSGGPLQRGLARCIRDVELGALLLVVII
jgi:uridine kinase